MAELVNEATRSLKAVSAWVDVIESNIAGSKRTAFKASRVSFGSGTKSINGGSEALQRRGLLPNGGDLFIPDSSLTITQITNDMRQGAIVGSDQDTHLAINGTGFFVVVDSLNLDGNTKVYYTRNGEFHYDVDGYLRTADGLYVMNRDFPASEAALIDLRARVAAGTEAAQNYFFNSMRVASVGPPPVNGADVTSRGDLDVNRVGLARFSNDGALSYSKYGTDYLEENLASGRAIYFAADDPAGFATLHLKSLEVSNGGITEFIPMLTVAQKAFAAISKIIAVYNSTVDDMNAMIR